jgi:hypothetical protein
VKWSIWLGECCSTLGKYGGRNNSWLTHLDCYVPQFHGTVVPLWYACNLPEAWVYDIRCTVGISKVDGNLLTAYHHPGRTRSESYAQRTI